MEGSERMNIMAIRLERTRKNIKTSLTPQKKNKKISYCMKKGGIGGKAEWKKGKSRRKKSGASKFSPSNINQLTLQKYHILSAQCYKIDRKYYHY